MQAVRALTVQLLAAGRGDAGLRAAGLLAPDLPYQVMLTVAEECGRTGLLDVCGGPLAQAAALAGIGERLMDLGVGYATQRRVFGRPLAEFQVQRHAFALASARLAASRALTWRAAQYAEPLDLATAAPVAADAAWLAAETALQVHGGNGYSDEYEVSRRWTQVARARASILSGAR